jgi:hypothetical protein
MAEGLPPPPLKSEVGDFNWLDWYNKLYRYLKTTGSIAWSSIDFSGSNITDIQTRDHNSLQGFQGGTAGEYYHLTAAQYGVLTNTPPYGAFHSEQTQSVSTINTPTQITFDMVDYNNLINLASNEFTVTQAGLYNVQFSIQTTNTDTQAHDLDIWIRQNGSDVNDCASVATVTGTHGGQPGYNVVAANFFVRCATNDKLQFWWSSNSTQVQLNYLPPITTPFTSPGAPSIVATFTYVAV